MAKELKEQEVVESAPSKKFSFKKIWKFIKDNFNLFIPYIGLVACIIIFSILPPIVTGRTIYTKAFLNSFVDRSLSLMIITLGAVFIYSMGSLDISIGATAGVASIIMVSISNAMQNAGVNQYVGILIGMIVAILFTFITGAINTSIGEFLHLPAVIGSIFVMFVAGGIQILIFLSKENITFYGNWDFFKNTWFRVVLVAVFGLIIFYLFKYTKIGKYTRAIGANDTVVRQAGVSVWKYRFLAYAVLGIAVVIACFTNVVRLSTVNRSTGNNFHMQIMVALILGGMPLHGGMKSRLSSAITGTMVYNLLDTGLILSGVPMNLTPFIKALIIFTLIVLTCRRKSTTLVRD